MRLDGLSVKWALELAGNVWLFGSNDNFFGGNKLEQDPLYVIKTQAIYTFRAGFWLGFGLGYGTGGQTEVNGVPRPTKQKNYRYGVSLAYPFNRYHGIRASIATAQNSGAGTEFDVFGVRYQYAWGDF